MIKIFWAGFFWLGETFFRKFFKCLQRAPLHFFPILQMNGCSKTPKGSPFTFFGTMRLTGDQKNFERKFQFFPHAGTVEENT